MINKIIFGDKNPYLPLPLIHYVCVFSQFPFFHSCSKEGGSMFIGGRVGWRGTLLCKLVLNMYLYRKIIAKFQPYTCFSIKEWVKLKVHVLYFHDMDLTTT